MSQGAMFGPEVVRRGGKRRLTDEPVYNRVLGCTACSLSETRQPVPYRGAVPSRVAIVGEAPGQQEDARGGPFVGPAGQLLQEQLRIHKVIPDRLFWMNVVSCWPPGTPTKKHVSACSGNAWAQLRLCCPEWVVLVGNVALEAMAPWILWGGKVRKITEMRGRVWTWEGMHWYPMIHPAAGLRERKYMTLFQQDVSRLVTMLRHGPEYSEDCLVCGLEVSRYDPTGTPFCKAHDRGVEFEPHKTAIVGQRTT